MYFSHTTHLSFPFFLLSITFGTFAQSPCPDPEKIFPCICNNFQMNFDYAFHTKDFSQYDTLSEANSTTDYYQYEALNDANNTIDYVKVVCSVGNSSAEIFSVFNNATWPSKQLKEFVLFGGNMAEEFPGGYFGGVSFERIAIINYEVDTIHLSALISSQDTLEELKIMFSHLKEFPWDTLPLLTKLTSLKLYGNELKDIRIRSDSLRELDISSNQIAALKSGWSAPNLTSLRMDMNPISEIPHGFLDGLGNLQEFHCFECHLGPTLFKGSLGFHSEIVTYIGLSWNDISNIEEGAITGVTPETFVGLDGNKIADLTEATFRPILEVLQRGFGSLSVMGWFYDLVICDPFSYFLFPQ
ncbi:unnamed protein product [Darwinula stevensoni]|uniref:Uncharacterized protein n=1 Tax=Darwinula stevensoni TaxID=69355 RepID=A0A7R8ZZF6_9CRUS|nr:unnamed protein product [Darwinula stevensoni]CAG0878699.1 unnamed protein product [Darwinula stevensoni]